MKTKTLNLLNLIKDAKYNKAYNYFVEHNYTKYKHIEWYADQWARAFVSCPVEDAVNYPGRKEVYR